MRIVCTGDALLPSKKRISSSSSIIFILFFEFISENSSFSIVTRWTSRKALECECIYVEWSVLLVSARVSITHSTICQPVNSALRKLCALHEMETYHKPNRMSCDKAADDLESEHFYSARNWWRRWDVENAYLCNSMEENENYDVQSSRWATTPKVHVCVGEWYHGSD